MKDQKILIAFYSRPDENYNVGSVEVGNTEVMAENIKASLLESGFTSVDLFKIEPVDPYPIDYQECVEIATKERNENARPAYIGDIDAENYDIIFFGYPIWWGDLPMICYSFLENHNWSGKTVIPFNTHEGSGNAGTFAILQGKFTDAELIGDGFNLSGKVAREENGKLLVENWLKTIDKIA